MKTTKRFITSVLLLFCAFAGTAVFAKEKGKWLYFLEGRETQSVNVPAPYGSDHKYIFIRLYDPIYNSSIYLENLLQGGMSITQVNPETVSHASIGFDLSDYFFGLTAGGKYNLKIERCLDVADNKYMKKCDPVRSSQSVYAIEVTPEEYERAYNLVYKNLTNKWLRYATLKNVKIAGLSIKRKFFTEQEQQELGKKATEEKFYDAKQWFRDYQSEPNTIKKFVCSGFVSWVLYNSVDSVHQWFDENKIDVNYVVPSDIPHIQNVKFLFSSTWDNYDRAALQFVHENQEFAEYFPEPVFKQGK